MARKNFNLTRRHVIKTGLATTLASGGVVIGSGSVAASDTSLTLSVSPSTAEVDEEVTATVTYDVESAWFKSGTITWGDGTEEEFEKDEDPENLTLSFTHTYSDPGTYTISVDSFYAGTSNDGHAFETSDSDQATVTIEDPGDHDRGHGNECDGYDEDNPGNSGGVPDHAVNEKHCN